MYYTLPLFQHIPVAFVKNFDGEIPGQFHLWNPTKKCWNVNVEKSNNRLYFQEGWALFLKDNGLEFGDLLVFHYAGKSEFYVEIYGKSCCQKRVVTDSSESGIPLNADRENHNEKKTAEQSEKRDNYGMDESRAQINLDDLSLKVSNGGIEASKTTMVKVEVIDLETEDSLPIKRHRPEETKHFEGNSQTRRGRVPSFRSHSGSDTKACEREVRALEAANKYIPKHPFFKLVMGMAYVTRGYLNIPMSFYKEYMKRKLKQGSTVIFQHSGRSWPVKFTVNRRPLARFSGGWHDFAKDNSIKLGDVCVFELTEKNVMKISIFRG
ncbi:B3 DNA binding domain containing protein [Trema orientale]|uniref:B3 DNA binding domain containing protein n=1 Tax=Trema orientale TaxID=63057 RepID=A0A2P5FXY4_TREOI|nr:B3 DNA binding domain containing protein [Trema orientale]